MPLCVVNFAGIFVKCLPSSGSKRFCSASSIEKKSSSEEDSSPELYPAGNSDGNWSNLSSVLAAFLLIDLATFDRKRGWSCFCCWLFNWHGFRFLLGLLKGKSNSVTSFQFVMWLVTSAITEWTVVDWSRCSSLCFHFAKVQTN